MTKKDWKKIGMESESDERVLKVLKEGPKSLAPGMDDASNEVQIR